MIKAESTNQWEKLTAKKYNDYAINYPMYKKTSKFLVKIANVRKDMVIVDLACGTGVTTVEILSKIGTSGKIIDIDSSKEMLAVSKKKNKQKNVSFTQLAAEKINTLTKESVDLVLCNSAFWQMNMDKTLRGINKILKKDGKFIFNLPSQYYKFPKEAKNVLFFSLMKKIADEEFGIKFEKRKLKLLDYKTINKIVKNNSFKINSFKILMIERTAKDIYEFNKIPAMTDRAFPGLSYSKRMKVLDKTYKRIDKSEKFMSKWIYFVIEKIA